MRRPQTIERERPERDLSHTSCQLLTRTLDWSV